MNLEITAAELAAKLRAGEGVQIVDVREPEEFALARIEGSELVPMGAVPQELQRLEGLSDEADLAILCHHGVRSLNVAAWLQQHGIENGFSVSGGIDRWSQEADPNVPRY